MSERQDGVNGVEVEVTEMLEILPIAASPG